MELYRRARGVLPSVFTFIRTVDQNERINIIKSSRNEKNTEQQEISNVPPNLTLNGMLEKTRRQMGDEKFFTYNAVSNNCQDFLLAFLQSSNIGTPENYTFVKQDTESLFRRLPILQKIAKSTTDLGATIGDQTDDLQRFFTGRGLPM